jgi:hypothetical protein
LFDETTLTPLAKPIQWVNLSMPGKPLLQMGFATTRGLLFDADVVE